jgi:hypothetical protein
VRMWLSDLEHFKIANARKSRPRDLPCALVRTVEEAKLYGIHAELFAEFIDYCFCRKGRGRCARCAIGGGLRFVDDDVVALYARIGHVIRRKIHWEPAFTGEPGKAPAS